MKNQQLESANLPIERFIRDRPVQGYVIYALNAATFQRGTPQDTKQALADAKTKFQQLEPVLASIRGRRNGWLAHLDPETIADPKALDARAKLTVPDVEQAFNETESILLKLALLYDGTFAVGAFGIRQAFFEQLRIVHRTIAQFTTFYFFLLPSNTSPIQLKYLSTGPKRGAARSGSSP